MDKVNLYRALDDLELLDYDPRALDDEVVAANPILANGEVVADRRIPDLEDEVGAELMFLDRRMRDALERRYGETLTARDRELIVSGVTLAVMTLRRYAILVGIPPIAEDARDIE